VSNSSCQIMPHSEVKIIPQQVRSTAEIMC
jgi:hypothetical protein